MAIETQAQIINRLTESARNLKQVQDRAARRRDSLALGEPEPIQTVRSNINPGLSFEGQSNRDNTP